MNFLRSVQQSTKALSSDTRKELNMQDSQSLFYKKRQEMMVLIEKQSKMRERRKFYTKEEKQIIMRYVQRFNQQTTDPQYKIFNPSVEEYVHDVSIMLDHILSYEFRTQTLDKIKMVKLAEQKEKNEFDVMNQSLITPGGDFLSQTIDLTQVFLVPIYREQPTFPPRVLNDCQTWWDVVALTFYGELATVTFVIDHQEEIVGYETQIQRAWLAIALSDFVEFKKVFDYLNCFDNKNKKVKELYNKESYVFENSASLQKIKDKFLATFNLVQPENPLIKRYAKFLYNNYQERFPRNKEFLLNLQAKFQFQVDDLSDFDYDEFNSQKTKFLKLQANHEKATGDGSPNDELESDRKEEEIDGFDAFDAVMRMEEINERRGTEVLPAPIQLDKVLSEHSEKKPEPPVEEFVSVEKPRKAQSPKHRRNTSMMSRGRSQSPSSRGAGALIQSRVASSSRMNNSVEFVESSSELVGSVIDRAESGSIEIVDSPAKPSGGKHLILNHEEIFEREENPLMNSQRQAQTTKNSNFLQRSQNQFSQKSADDDLSHSNYGRSSNISFISMTKSATKILETKQALRKHIFTAKEKKKADIFERKSQDSDQPKKKPNFMRSLSRVDKKRFFADKYRMSKTTIQNQKKILPKDLQNYKIVQKQGLFEGKQLFYIGMQNSDLLFHNRLQQIFSLELFNKEARAKYLTEIRRKFNFDKLQGKETCEDCEQLFVSYLGGLFTNKEFCELCMNFICNKCITNSRKLFPQAELLIQFTADPLKLGTDPKNLMQKLNKQTRENEATAEKIKDGLFYPKNVCRNKCRARLEKYQFVQIDMRNPLLTSNPKLRSLVVLRRKCHLLFDRIKCEGFEELLAKTTQAFYHEYKNALRAQRDNLEIDDQDYESITHRRYKFDHLVMRENIFSYMELGNLPELKFKLGFLYASLAEHFQHKPISLEGDKIWKLQSGCQKCILVDIHCFECNLKIESKEGGKTQLASLAQCSQCLKYFHKMAHEKQSLDIYNPKRRFMQQSCLERHICVGLFDKYLERNKEEYEAEMAREYDDR